jgi:hypothetical protein
MSNFSPIFITMTRGLELMVNLIFRDDVKLLFGEDCYINIDSIRFSTNTKTFIVHTKVLIKDITNENINEYREKLVYLISEGWRYLGKDSPITVVTSIDII